MPTDGRHERRTQAEPHRGFALWVVAGVVLAAGGMLGIVVLCLTHTPTAEACPPSGTSYRLTLNISGNGSVTLDPPNITVTSSHTHSYQSGTSITLTAEGSSGWHFGHWEGHLTGSTNPATIVMDSNKGVTAVFVQKFTLRTSVWGGGAVSPSGGTYDPETNVTLTAIPNSGWQFDHWQEDLSGSANPGTITMNSDKSVKAVFVGGTFTLTTSVQGQGSVSPSGGTYNPGTELALTASPASGWMFGHWEGDLDGSANPARLIMDGDKSVTGVFITDLFTLTTSVRGEGSVSPSGGTYNPGAIVSLTASPASQWLFGRWGGDLSGSTNPGTITMNADKSVTAWFAQVDRIERQYAQGAWARLSSAPSLVYKGQTGTYRAVARPSGTTWPSGKPVWGGTAGASGTGETTSVTFNTESSNWADYKTLTAECGNTVTANLLIANVKITQFQVGLAPCEGPQYAWTFITNTNNTCRIYATAASADSNVNWTVIVPQGWQCQNASNTLTFDRTASLPTFDYNNPGTRPGGWQVVLVAQRSTGLGWSAGATQNAKDRLRQQYVDMGKSQIPPRGDFVDETSYGTQVLTWDQLNCNGAQTECSAICQAFPHRAYACNSTVSTRFAQIEARYKGQYGQGREINVSCAYRCPYHNVCVDGDPNSRHIYGNAFDFLGSSTQENWEIAWAAYNNGTPGATTPPARILLYDQNDNRRTLEEIMGNESWYPPPEFPPGVDAYRHGHISTDY